MDTESEQKRLSKLRLGRTSIRLVSPTGREGSPSPYDFCNDSRSDDEDDECQREAEIHHSRCQGRYKQDEEEDGCVHNGTHGSYGTDAQNDQELTMGAVADMYIGDNSEKSEAGVQSFSKRSGMSAECYEGPEEGADDNSFYAALYKEPLSVQEGDLPLDIENNALLWVAPPPEDEEGQMGISGGDDDEDDSGLTHSPGSLSSSEYRSKENSTIEEQRKAMRAVVDGHFRVLVSQLLNGEGIRAGEGGQQSWSEIVTSLSLQAASVIKPDTSIGGGMDPGGYVKVKCVATGWPSESQVVKGIVCKKNVAHRRMTTRFKTPRLLLLGGALEFQNQFSSLETLLQQETDHISMAVSRIGAHHPNVLLVEKTVSRQAQDCLLAKEISLVLNVKRPLLERIARCTGASIISNLEHLTSTESAKVGRCEAFHVEKYFEEHENAGQGGKKLMKTLMFFEDCPKPLGCTILLKGSNVDELKKVKRAVQFAVFAAYHLALETSFLADEGVDLPELRLKSPLSVALPDKKSKSDMSISTVSGFLAPTSLPTGNQAQVRAVSLTSTSVSAFSNLTLNFNDLGLREPSPGASVLMPENSSLLSSRANSPLSSPIRGHEVSNDADSVKPYTSSTSSGLHEVIGATLGKLSPAMTLEDFGQGVLGFTASLRRGFLESSSAAKASESPPATKLFAYDGPVLVGENTALSAFEDISKSPVQVPSISAENQTVDPPLKRMDSNGPASELHVSQTTNQDDDGQDLSLEDFPPSPSNHQSILVSFSSSCLRKGTICDRGHLYRIKYYGTFDKPLGRFLQETIFDRTYRCPACGEPKDAHVDCYTHRQGSLTISIHKQNQALPGEKIWMWHRCLKCARVNGIPPATHRLVMSDPARRLSFGKFLELSFSNHAAASRVASCGHSLHHDCLRFYGFGNMVACFRYSPVNVYSVYLPPAKLEFHYSKHQDWLQQEIDEIAEKGSLFFKDVFNRLHGIQENVTSISGKVPEANNHISELEDILSKQKDGFQTALHNAASCHGADQPHVDILQLNHIRQSLSNCSSLWENRIQSLLSSLKSPKSSPAFDSVLIGDSFFSFLKDISFGSSRNRKSDVNKEASVAESPNLDGSNLELIQGTGAPACRGGVSLSNSVLSESVKAAEGTGPVIDVESADSSIIGLHSMKESVEVNLSAEGSLALSKTTRIEAFNNPESLSSLDAGLEDRLHASSCSSGSSSLPTKAASVINAELLKGDVGVHRSLSEGHFSAFRDVSARFDAAWTGEGQSMDAPGLDLPLNEQEITISKRSAESEAATNEESKRSSSKTSDEGSLEHCTQKLSPSVDSQLASTLTSPAKAGEPSDIESWVGAPYSSFSGPYSGNGSSTLSGLPPRADAHLLSTSPFVVPHAEQVAVQEGVKASPSAGINETVVSVYDDEPTSVIAYAIISQEHQGHLFDKADKRKEKKEYTEKDEERTVPDYNGGGIFHSFQLVEGSLEQGDGKEGIFLSSSELSPDVPVLYSKDTHVKVNFTDDTPQGKIKYTVTCYYAKQFDGLRKRCCPNEMDFIRSLCRCKKWGAQGGKSNVFFAKTVDDRFVVKQVTKTELDSFITFAPAYFKYISDALVTGSPTCLAKILGIYQVMVKHVKGGKEVRMDLMIMENLLYGRHVSRVYDLKGSLRSRYNADATGKNAVLLDQNLLESIQTNSIFMSNKAKRLLERAVWNDTAFLESVDVMDYSLLVGVDEDRRDLVLGIIDFMRQYTWDKHLETWVKASGILGGPKNATPTVISPKQYKKRFRKAMSTYFLMVPDQWSPLTVVSDLVN